MFTVIQNPDGTRETATEPGRGDCFREAFEAVLTELKRGALAAVIYAENQTDQAFGDLARHVQPKHGALPLLTFRLGEQFGPVGDGGPPATADATHTFGASRTETEMNMNWARSHPELFVGAVERFRQEHPVADWIHQIDLSREFYVTLTAIRREPMSDRDKANKLRGHFTTIINEFTDEGRHDLADQTTRALIGAPDSSLATLYDLLRSR